MSRELINQPDMSPWVAVWFTALYDIFELSGDLEKKRQNQLHLKNRNLADGPQIFLYDKHSEDINWAEYAAVSFMSSFQTSASEAFPLELKKIK